MKWLQKLLQRRKRPFDLTHHNDRPDQEGWLQDTEPMDSQEAVSVSEPAALDTTPLAIDPPPEQQSNYWEQTSSLDEPTVNPETGLLMPMGIASTDTDGNTFGDNSLSSTGFDDFSSDTSSDFSHDSFDNDW